jgi:hypothetical protein
VLHQGEEADGLEEPGAARRQEVGQLVAAGGGVEARALVGADELEGVGPLRAGRA